ncbi:MAG: hypothetical protein VCA18_03035 [Opitutales bacterium]
MSLSILDLLGINRKHLIYRHQWRDYRITDMHGRIIREILA